MQIMVWLANQGQTVYRVLSVILMLLSSSAWSLQLYSVGPTTNQSIVSQINEGLSRAIAPTTTVSSHMAGGLTDDAVIVTIGPNALKEVLSGEGSAPVIALLVSQEAYASITRPFTQRPVTAIYSDSAPDRQIALTRALYGANASAFLVHSPDKLTSVARYRKAAKRFGVTLVTQEAAKVPSLNTFIKQAKPYKTLLLLKDKVLFNRLSLDDILLYSYDINHQAVVGYNRALVNNGAAATTFSSLAQMIDAGAEQIQRQLNAKPFDPPHYPEHFNVQLNNNILRSLNSVYHTEDAVMQSLQQLLNGEQL